MKARRGRRPAAAQARYRPRLVPISMRGHFTRQGNPKRRYTETAAKAAAVRHHKTAYPCDTCTAWHIGGSEG